MSIRLLISLTWSIMLRTTIAYLQELLLVLLTVFGWRRIAPLRLSCIPCCSYLRTNSELNILPLYRYPIWVRDTGFSVIFFDYGRWWRWLLQFGLPKPLNHQSLRPLALSVVDKISSPFAQGDAGHGQCLLWRPGKASRKGVSLMHASEALSPETSTTDGLMV